MAIRRLTFDELQPDLQDVLRPKVDRLGYLGEFFAVAGHQPAATAAFQRFTESLKDALPAELSETVALTVASFLGNDYERSQHEQLASTLGFSEAWIAAAEGRGPASTLSKAAAAARNLAMAVLDDMGHGAHSALERLCDIVGEEAAVGVLLTVGRYVAHAVVSNTLELAAPVSFVVHDVSNATSRK